MNTQEQQQPPPGPQVHAAPPLGLTVNEETDAASPSVVVANQTSGGRQTSFVKQPFFRRGAQLSNGCRCGGMQITLLFSVGGVLVIFGFVNFVVLTYYGIFFLVVGGTLVGVGVCVVRSAKAQFDSLPPDHPDRVRYNVPRSLVTSSRRQRRGGQPRYTYTVPPMQHQVMTSPAPPGGEVMYFPAQPGGQGQAFVPAPPATNAPSAPVMYGDPIVPGAGAAPAYPRSLQGSYVPENDPPPAYWDVVKDA